MQGGQSNQKGGRSMFRGYVRLLHTAMHAPVINGIATESIVAANFESRDLSVFQEPIDGGRVNAQELSYFPDCKDSRELRICVVHELNSIR
jgi:hypothetical protein